MPEVIKGWLGEKLTTFGMWLRLDSGVYRRVHNIIVPDARNHTTQIDHVLVSIYGLFVIETKNMDGWIFGSAQQEMWTQQLFRKRFQFQNPASYCAIAKTDAIEGISHFTGYRATIGGIYKSKS
jgi:restriction system protein